MGTIAEKLQNIAAAKADIGAAITEKGGSVPQRLSEYGDAIRAIPGGGSAGTVGPLDPWEVYRATRPADWLPMPEPGAKEIYLLLHIPDGTTELLAFSLNKAFTVTLGRSDQTGFLPAEQLEPVEVEASASYETALAAEDWGDLTGDGSKQVMVKISIDPSSTGIVTFQQKSHSGMPDPEGYADWNIVEIWSGGARLFVGSSPNGGEGIAEHALRRLRYVNYVGEPSLTTFANSFRRCGSLLAVLGMPKAPRTFGSTFEGCGALTCMTAFNVNSTGYVRAFLGCRELGELDMKILGSYCNLTNTFDGCINLRRLTLRFPSASTTVNDLKYAFRGCLRLTELTGLPCKAGDMTGAFEGCISLERLTFDPAVEGWTGADLSIADCKLGHAALVEFLESLPAVSEAHTVTLAGNPGAAELTEAEKAIAAGKGWTVATEGE